MHDMKGRKTRDDLKCLSIGNVYDKLQYLSRQEGTSASGWVRRKVIAEFRKEKKKELMGVDA